MKMPEPMEYRGHPDADEIADAYNQCIEDTQNLNKGTICVDAERLEQENFDEAVTNAMENHGCDLFHSGDIAFEIFVYLTKGE